MSKPSAPQAPNPTATAAASETANVGTAASQAALNNVNQVTPYGSLTYDQTGNYTDNNGDSVPQYTATESLSPTEQNLFNLSQTGEQGLGQAAVGLLGQVQNQYANPINYSGLPGIASSASSNIPINTNFAGGVQQFGGSTDAAMQQAENAAYQGQTQYLNPQFTQAQEALSNNLINQGVTQGSQAANTAQQNFGLQENQAYGNAADQAVQAGQAEQNTLFGQGATNANLQNTAASLQNTAQSQQFGEGLSNAQLQNSAQAQALQQLYAEQNQPLNEYNALATGSQVTQPQFNSTPQTSVGQTNVGQITNSAYQNQLAAYQQQMAGINNLFSLGGSLGSAAILA